MSRVEVSIIFIAGSGWYGQEEKRLFSLKSGKFLSMRYAFWGCKRSKILILFSIFYELFFDTVVEKC